MQGIEATIAGGLDIPLTPVASALKRLRYPLFNRSASQSHRQALAVPEGAEDQLRREGCRRPKLGKLGEEFVYDLERHRLKEAGRDDLALKVQWVAQSIGDGLGFDILSFDETCDSERMLEVKATVLGKFFPFYVTANEVRCSDDIPD